MKETKTTSAVRYNQENARLRTGAHEGKPRLSIVTKGQFRVNRVLMEQMGAKQGDGVELLHVPQADEWYMAKAKQQGLQLQKGRNGSAQFSSAIIYRRMQPAMEHAPKGAFLVAREPSVVDGTRCFAILFGSGKK